MKDGSYTPMEAAFKRFLGDGEGKTASEIDALRRVFFSGAASAVGAINRAPESFETIFSELTDFVSTIAKTDKVL